MPPASTPALGPVPGDEHVGVIYGNVGTTEFRFAVSAPDLKRLDYVKVRHETDGIVLAQVTEVTRESSLSHDQATEIGIGMGAAPASDRVTARAKVVGYRDSRGLLAAPRTPFRAGELLFRADDPLIASIFGLRDHDGAFLGFIKGYDLPVHLDINTLVQKHVSILAKTGSGKSYVVGVLMEELIKRGIPIVIVDPHGEHGSLARLNVNENDYPAMRRFGVRPRAYGEHIIEYSPDTRLNPDAMPLRLDGVGLSAADLAECLHGLSTTQMGILHGSVRELADHKDDYTLEDVLEKVKEHNSNAKWNLVSALELLISLDVFAHEGTPVSSLVKRDKVSILNLKGVAPHVQELIVATVAKKLFESRKGGKVPPFMLVVEEAHNFCPERGIHSSLSSDVLRTIASEGRKFGMGLTVVSQRPAKIDKNVLSQCNTQIILKVTNPNDLKAITASVEGLTADAAEEIQRISVGTAVVSHPRISMPILVDIRPRETAHGGQSVDVMSAVQEEETFLTKAAPPAKPKAAATTEEGGEEDDEEPEEDADFDLRLAEARAREAVERAIVDEPTTRTIRPREPRPLTLPPAPWAEAPLPPAAPVRPPPPLPRAAPAAAATPAPAWIRVVEDEVESLEGADLRRWDEAALERLLADLHRRLADLQALPAEHQDQAQPVVARVARLKAHVEERVDQMERRRNSLIGRLFSPRRAKDEPDPEDAVAAADPAPAPKRPKRARLEATQPPRPKEDEAARRERIAREAAKKSAGARKPKKRGTR